MTHDAKNCTAGVLATASSLTITLAGLNDVLTCVSLLIGIAVGVVTLINLLRNKRKNHHRKNHEH